MNIAKRPPQMNWVYENPKAEIKIAVIPLRNVYNGESTHAIIFVDIGSKSYETAVLSLDECCRYKKLMESLQLMPDLSAKEKKKAGEVLRRSIIQQQKEGELPLYFDKNGCYCLTNKSWVAVEGDTTIGINPQICYVIDPQVEKLKLLRTNNAQPVTRLLKSIYNEPDELYLLDQIKDEHDEIAKERDVISLHQSMHALNARELDIIRRRYYEDQTQMEIATELGISQAQVSRLEKNAIRSLRRQMDQ